MSAKVSGLIWEVGPSERNQRFVLLAIADNAGDDGYASVDIGVLSEKCLFSRRHIMRAIQDLELGGWLRVLQRPRDGRVNDYRINMKRMSDLRKEAWVA